VQSCEILKGMAKNGAFEPFIFEQKQPMIRMSGDAVAALGARPPDHEARGRNHGQGEIGPD
jgi:hypothetical protein